MRHGIVYAMESVAEKIFDVESGGGGHGDSRQVKWKFRGAVVLEYEHGPYYLRICGLSIPL